MERQLQATDIDRLRVTAKRLADAHERDHNQAMAIAGSVSARCMALERRVAALEKDRKHLVQRLLSLEMANRDLFAHMKRMARDFKVSQETLKRAEGVSRVGPRPDRGKRSDEAEYLGSR